jgi:type-F conjugative transfer system pilin assembly protein TrbC
VCLTCFTSLIFSANALDDSTKIALDKTMKMARNDAILKSKEFGQCKKSTPCFKSMTSTQTLSKNLNDDGSIVFISSTMPMEALKKLSHQVTTLKKKGKRVRLVLRGMVQGSMLKTTSFSKEMGVPIDLDPKLFEKFKIRHVPVFIEKTSQGYRKIQGNVELDFALQKLGEQP